MTEDKILATDHSVNQKHVYLSIIMDVGRSSGDIAKAYRLPTQDPRQIALVVRGLRPSHILVELSETDKKKIDEQFQLILNANVDEGLRNMKGEMISLAEVNITEFSDMKPLITNKKRTREGETEA